MTTPLSHLALALCLLPLTASAEVFELNGVVTDINLANTSITIDEHTYLLPNKITDANSNNSAPALFQLQIGSVVRVTGDDSTQHISSLAILHQPTTEERQQQEPSR